ncbi:hypothetical protein Micbo1qcDRAFT_158814, partial [Microdochium bolleyi]
MVPRLSVFLGAGFGCTLLPSAAPVILHSSLSRTLRQCTITNRLQTAISTCPSQRRAPIGPVPAHGSPAHV